MSDPVRIVVGSGESAEIRVASSSESAEIRIPESSLIVGPPGPAGEDGATFFPEVSEEGVISWTNDGGYDNPEPVNIKGPAGNDGSDGEDGEDGVSPTVSFTTITGGHTMTVTDKDHPSGQSINIMDGESGGGGTTDYDDLTDKPSINGTTLSGNKTTADLGLGTYSKPSGGIPASDLASAVQSKLDNTVVVSDTQPTATENKLWVDTDAGAGSTYQVPTVAEMEAEISSHVPLFRTHSIGSEQIVAGATRTITYTIPSITGYTPRVMSVHIPDTSNVNYAKVFLVWNQSGTTINAHVFNTSTAQVAPSPYAECLYLPT